MEKTTREIEKGYLKLDEPVLNNVLFPSPRFLTLFKAPDPSNKKNSKILKNILTKKKSNKLLNIFRSKESKAIGGNV